jgi:hypothetical protein
MRAATVGLSPYRQKLALRAGENGSVHAVAGLDAYQYVNPSGNMSLLVPELNFFAVVRQNLDGRREVYSEIEVGPQPDELFGPPVGANVHYMDIPGGIVIHSADSAFHRLAGHDRHK